MSWTHYRKYSYKLETIKQKDLETASTFLNVMTEISKLKTQMVKSKSNIDSVIISDDSSDSTSSVELVNEDIVDTKSFERKEQENHSEVDYEEEITNEVFECEDQDSEIIENEENHENEITDKESECEEVTLDDDDDDDDDNDETNFKNEIALEVSEYEEQEITNEVFKCEVQNSEILKNEVNYENKITDKVCEYEEVTLDDYDDDNDDDVKTNFENEIVYKVSACEKQVYSEGINVDKQINSELIDEEMNSQMCEVGVRIKGQITENETSTYMAVSNEPTTSTGMKNNNKNFTNVIDEFLKNLTHFSQNEKQFLVENRYTLEELNKLKQGSLNTIEETMHTNYQTNYAENRNEKSSNKSFSSVNSQQLESSHISTDEEIIISDSEDDEDPKVTNVESEEAGADDVLLQDIISIEDPEEIEEIFDADNTLFYCFVCNKGFTDKIVLETHLKTVHTVAKQLKCFICGTYIHSIKYFERHMKTEHGKTGNMVTLKSNIITLHDNISDFNCAACLKQFDNASLFYKHYSIGHKGKTRIYKCCSCDNEFLSFKGLSRHVMIIHRIIERFKCHVCGKIFSKRSALNDHIVQSHKENN